MSKYIKDLNFTTHMQNDCIEVSQDTPEVVCITDPLITPNSSDEDDLINRLPFTLAVELIDNNDARVHLTIDLTDVMDVGSDRISDASYDSGYSDGKDEGEETGRMEGYNEAEEEYQEKIIALEEAHDDEIANLKEEHEQEILSANERITDLEDQLKDITAKYEQMCFINK